MCLPYVFPVSVRCLKRISEKPNNFSDNIDKNRERYIATEDEFQVLEVTAIVGTSS
jgi:hypothetical protein